MIKTSHHQEWNTEYTCTKTDHRLQQAASQQDQECNNQLPDLVIIDSKKHAVIPEKTVAGSSQISCYDQTLLN